MKYRKTKFKGVFCRVHPTRKNGIKYDEYYMIRHQFTGKVYQEAIGWASKGHTAKEASLIRDQLRENQKAGIEPFTYKEMRAERQREVAQKKQAEKEKAKQAARDSITFANLFDRYSIHNDHKTPRTLKTESTYHKNWINPAIGKMKLKNIQSMHLWKIKKAMEKAGRAPRSIQYCLAIVRQVFNYGISEGLYSDVNPVKKIKQAKFDNERKRFLTSGECGLILDAVKKRSIETWSMCLLGLDCGLRAGEIFKLTWGDINFQTGTIAIKDAKNKSSDYVYMTSDVKAMFEARQPGAPSELIFKDRNGKPHKRISNSFNRSVDDLGLNDGIKDRRDKVVFHTLRHTFGSWLVQAGLSIFEVKERMRHKDIGQTMRYAHLQPDAGKNAVAIIESRKQKAGNVIDFNIAKNA